MPYQDIDVGAGESPPAAATTETRRSALVKTKAMFAELYPRVEAVEAPTVLANAPRTASGTLALADAGRVVEMDVATANTITVPPNSAVAFPVGTVIEVCQVGAGATTVAAGAGVTVRNVGALRAQWSSATLRKRGTDEWVLGGDLA